MSFCQRQLGKLFEMAWHASCVWFSFLSVHIQVCCAVGTALSLAIPLHSLPEAEGLLLSAGFMAAVRKAISKNLCTNS